jgi:D-glycero-D-manno-heptose 1,7-bisphosphate phosphatase
MNSCVFLDRDGVLNIEKGTYTWRIEDFELIGGVNESLEKLKKNGFLIIVVTNQAGISRGLYTKSEMLRCNEYLEELTRHRIDDIYYATAHPDFTESLLRKPDSLMFEKAIAKYSIDPARSWMVGNSERDLIPAIKLGIRSIFVGEGADIQGNRHTVANLLEASVMIIENQ